MKSVFYQSVASSTYAHIYQHANLDALHGLKSWLVSLAQGAPLLTDEIPIERRQIWKENRCIKPKVNI